MTVRNLEFVQPKQNLSGMHQVMLSTLVSGGGTTSKKGNQTLKVQLRRNPRLSGFSDCLNPNGYFHTQLDHSFATQGTVDRSNQNPLHLSAATPNPI
jgi:hypothetical protein